jgi:carboxylesterase type B
MPRRNVTARRQKVYEDVLAATKCTTLQCLQSASPEILQAANHHLISEVPAGTGGGAFGPSIGFAPSPDKVYVLDEPMVLLRDRSTAPRKSLSQLLVGNMAHDGMNLVADNNMPASFGELVRTAFPTANNRTVARIQELFQFPPSKPWQLAWDWATSVIFACHSQSIAAAYAETARRYVMAIPPATHAEDLSCWFPHLFQRWISSYRMIRAKSFLQICSLLITRQRQCPVSLSLRRCRNICYDL